MSTLYAVTGQDVVRLVERDDKTWETTVLLANTGAQCLAIDPHDPTRLLTGTFEQGALVSTDAGATWQPLGDRLPHQRVLSVEISPSRQEHGRGVLYVGTEPSSIFSSVDNGMTWQDHPALRELPSAPEWSFPPRPWTSHVRWIAASWHDPELLFAGIELGGVMRSTDGGVTWEDRRPGSYHDCHALRTHPQVAERVYEAAGGGVAWSHDRGDTWAPFDDGMDRHYAWALAIDPEDPDHWFVSASHGPRNAHGDHGSAEAHIYRKRGDAQWELLTNGLNPPMDEMPYALLIPRDDRSTVFAGTRQGSLVLSRDHGDHWTKTTVDLPGILALAHSPE